MTIAFDHIVLLVNDLDAAARDFQSLGFTVQERADTKHDKTRFRFVCFEDGSYILLTAFASPEDQAAHRLGEVLAAGEGMADWSFCLPDVDATAGTMQDKGLPTRGPVAVGNVIATGETWALRLLMCGRGAGGDVCLPFVVSDVEGREFRIPAPKAHANGATGMTGLSLSTADPELVGRTLETLGCTNEGAGLYAYGAARVQVLPLDAPLSRPGGGIVEAILRGPEDKVLDPALTHGAPIRMVKG